MRANRYCISCGRLCRGKRCSTCQRKSRKQITVFGIQRPEKPEPIEALPPVKLEVVVPYTGLLEAPKPPPERERKYPRIDLSHLRET